MPGKGKQFEEGNKASQGHGRPKGSGHVEICQEYATQKGWQKLIDLAEGVRVETIEGQAVRIPIDSKLQFEALKLVIAYAVGRPPEKLDVSSGGVTLFDWLRGQFRPGLGDGSGSPSA